MANHHLIKQLELFTILDAHNVRHMICKSCHSLCPEDEFRKGEKVFKRCHACRVKNREYESFHRVKFLYGISKSEYFALLEAQGGGCAICGRTYGEMRGKQVRLDVDHDHATGKVRGLLCNQCNTRIANLGDDLVMIEAMAIHVERRSSSHSHADYWQRAAAYMRRVAE